MGSSTSARKLRVNFEPVILPTPLRTRRGWIFLVGVIGIAFACALGLQDRAFWPSPQPTVAIFALAIVLAVADNFGTHRTVDGFSEYASLAMPIGFAMLLLLDWRAFTIALALAESITFVSESLRHINPTFWYIRIFNVSSQVVAGAAAATVLHVLRPLQVASAGIDVLSMGPAIALLLAAVVWKVFDNVIDSTFMTLALDRPLFSTRVPARVFLSQFALFLIGIPFAYVWAHSVWISLFALAPLGVAYRLLGLPELEYRVRTDERTGLTNAGSFERAVKSAIDVAAERREGLVLLAIDLDHFKAVNDSFGHLVGDAVLVRFATLVLEVARHDDIAARTGGEEFGLLMREADRDSAIAFAERLRARVEEERFDIDGLETPIAVTASIGVAVYPEDARVARDLFAAADAALYRAKREGRNAVRVATSETASR